MFSGGFIKMRWKKKLVFFLIVYFAGFATAIYMLVPGSATDSDVSNETAETNLTASISKTNNLALSFRAGMDKCFDLAKRGGEKIGKVGREKLIARVEKNEILIADK